MPSSHSKHPQSTSHNFLKATILSLSLATVSINSTQAATSATATTPTNVTASNKTQSATSATSHASQVEAAWAAAKKVAKLGETSVDIASQATLQVPKGYAFIPQQEGNNLLVAMGNSNATNLAGLLVPTTDEADTMYVIRYKNDGYVKDTDAKDLNADDILRGYKEGTEESNKERVARGFPALEVTGWGEKPQYDAAKHRLTWALIAHDKGVATTQDDGINYETRLLGREGYVSMTMLGNAKSLAKDKVQADQLSTGLTFTDSKRYEDYKEGDHLAEYGLAALITGVAAKKLGLLALMAAFFAKFAKLIGIAVIGGFVFLKSIFKRKSKTAETAPAHTVTLTDTTTDTAPTSQPPTSTENSAPHSPVTPVNLEKKDPPSA